MNSKNELEMNSKTEKNPMGGTMYVLSQLLKLSHVLESHLFEIPKIRATEYEENPIAYLKFYNLLGRGTWYVTEMGETPNHDILFFGYCISPLGDDCDEFGYFTLNELLKPKVIFFDNTFKPQPIKELIQSHKY